MKSFDSDESYRLIQEYQSLRMVDDHA